MRSASRDDSDVVYRALRVALRAIQLHIAWHSGVISSDAAMDALEQEIQFESRSASEAKWPERLGNGDLKP
jgi:hypothetical protein